MTITRRSLLAAVAGMLGIALLPRAAAPDVSKVSHFCWHMKTGKMEAILFSGQRVPCSREFAAWGAEQILARHTGQRGTFLIASKVA
jgi:hypothetical protein